MFRLFIRFSSIFSLVFLISCSGNDRRAGAISNPEELYLDYRITAEEGNDKLTVLLRFRDEEEGDAFMLPPGTTVLLDNSALEADSSKRTGGFYETHLAIDSFQGKHTLLLKQGDQTIHEQSFDFFPMLLEEEPGDSVSRQDLILRLGGVQKEEYVRVIATDTAFYSEGINRMDTIRDRRLLISQTDLETLVNGPVQLLLSREWEIPLEKGERRMGRLSVSYSLRREFILKD